MNALAPITYTNACPPAYRNLSAKAECRLRSKRTGIQETPGGLPRHESKDDIAKHAANRRQRILELIGEGHDTRFKLRAALNRQSWMDYALDTLERDRLVETNIKTGVVSLAVRA